MTVLFRYEWLKAVPTWTDNLLRITYCSDGTTENGEPALVAGTRAFLPRWTLALTAQRRAIRLRGGRTAVSARAVVPSFGNAQ